MVLKCQKLKQQQLIVILMPLLQIYHISANAMVIVKAQEAIDILISI